MSKRILYLDDESINLQLFRLTFGKDFEITTAETPAEALGLIAEQRFQVVISDMKMPEMSGIDFLARVKELSAATPCVLVTGLLEDEAIQAAQDQGTIDFVVHKPWLKAELREVLEQACQANPDASA